VNCRAVGLNARVNVCPFTVTLSVSALQLNRFLGSASTASRVMDRRSVLPPVAIVISLAKGACIPKRGSGARATVTTVPSI
jgi:hypothetical protein